MSLYASQAGCKTLDVTKDIWLTCLPKWQHYSAVPAWLVHVILGIKPRAWCVLGKHSTKWVTSTPEYWVLGENGWLVCNTIKPSQCGCRSCKEPSNNLFKFVQVGAIVSKTQQTTESVGCTGWPQVSPATVRANLLQLWSTMQLPESADPSEQECWVRKKSRARRLKRRNRNWGADWKRAAITFR